MELFMTVKAPITIISLAMGCDTFSTTMSISDFYLAKEYKINDAFLAQASLRINYLTGVWS